MIQTQFVNPPISERKFDWSAVEQGYEPGDPIGYGETEQQAIDNLRSHHEQSIE